MPQPPKPLARKQEVKSYVSPKIADLVFFEIRDATIAKYKTPPAFGTAHPETVKYPNHKLVFIAPSDGDEPLVQKWYYAAERSSQDDYNFRKDDTNLTRTYIIPRSDYLAGSPDYVKPTRGDADPVFAGYTFTDEEVKRSGDSMQDTFFVVVERTYINNLKVVSETETGTVRGETGTVRSKGDTQIANAVAPGIITSQRSTLGENQIWDNTENRLEPRIGVFRCNENFSAGYKVTSTTEQSLTEPTADAADNQFSKSLVVTDVEGTDALWEANRSTRVNAPVVGSQVNKFLGGGVADLAIELVAEADPADSGFLVVDSSVRPLGNGDGLKTTLTLPAFPTLVDYQYDNSLDALLRITKDVVDTATNPIGSKVVGDVTEIRSVDKWRSLSIRTEGIGVPKTDYLPGVFNFRFPPVLLSAEWIGAYAYAGNGTRYAWDFDIALIFDVVESFSAAVDGRTIRVITADPSAVIGDYPPINFAPQSHTIGFVSHGWSASPTVWAKASARTWQTPSAINPLITLDFPDQLGGQDTITVDAEKTASIPATSPTSIPSGWTTIGVQSSRLKLGYYEVIIRQINSPGS